MLLRLCHLVAVLLIWDTANGYERPHTRPHSSNSDIGSKAEFTCTPKKVVDVIWLDKNGDLITNGNGKTIETDNGISYLYIDNIRSEDYGEFGCVEILDGFAIYASRTSLKRKH